MWMNNIYEEWEQNKKNEIVKGTIKSMIQRCHPHTVYAEADISNYNINAYTFEERAKDWSIPLDILKGGPMIMPMYQNHGEMFWGSIQTDTVDLAKAVHEYLNQVEQDNWNDSKRDCDIQLIFDEANEYVIYNPWNPYDHYTPKKPDRHHVQRMKREKKFSLAEPEKAFT